MEGTVISWERLDLIFVWGGQCEVVMYGHVGICWKRFVDSQWQEILQADA